MEWPNKDAREEFELKGFIDSYQKLSNGRVFSDIDKREHKDKPDRIVQDVNTGELFGIELTSEYIDNRSVRDRHIDDNGSTKPGLLKIYEQRILNRIEDKISKARSGYDLGYPLILSIYVNEYESIYMDEAYWRSFSKRNNDFFDDIKPFIEVVFWSLPNGLVVSAKCKRKGA